MNLDLNSLWDFIAKVAVVMLAIVIYFILKYYWPKYFETKASNQATKEDIGEITNIVENIKNDLLTKTEEIKIELNRKSEHIISLNSTERLAILNYNQALWAAILYFNTAKLNDYDETNIEKIGEINTKAEDLLLIKDMAEAELTLFFDNLEFSELNSEIRYRLIAMRHNLAVAIINKTTSTKKAIINFKSSTDNTAVYKQMYNEISVIMEEYYTANQKAYGEILEIWRLLKPVVLKRLKEIADS
jgi:hypothetical protein